MVIALSTELDLQSGEDNSRIMLKKLKFKQGLKLIAGLVLASAMKYKIMCKKGGYSEKELSIQEGKLRRYIGEFQVFRVQQRDLYGLDNFDNILENKINFVSNLNQKNKED